MSQGRADIAVIGLACAFPEAANARLFWESAIRGGDAAPDSAAGRDVELAAAEALSDAGYGDPARLKNLGARTEVIVGNATPGLLDTISGRIAGRFGLTGPNYMVSAGGASSLVAVELAVNDLRGGRCDMVLAGGVHSSTQPAATMAISSQVKAFSQGMGMLVLKRLEDAGQAGDRVYAVIEGVSACSGQGREEAFQRACEAATVDPASVELLAGHTGSGMDGLIRTILALHHKVRPPDRHAGNFFRGAAARPWIHGSPAPRRAGVEASGGIHACAVLEEYTGPHPAACLQHAWDSEMFVISGATRPEMLREAERLLEFVSSFAGELPLKDLAWTLNRDDPKPSRLVIVAVSRDDLKEKLGRAVERLRDERTARIRAIDGIYYFSRPLAGKVALVFPGEGAQYVHMLADLCVHFPEVRTAFDRMDRAFADHPRGLPSEAIFPPPDPDGAAARDDRLYSMDGGAAAVFAANLALYALLEKLGIRADAMAGHSIGEHTALLASGIVRAGSEPELIRHVRGVNAIFEELKNSIGIPQGTLLTVAGADHALLEKLVAESEGELHIALDNCPHQVVICGAEAAIDGMIQALTGRVAICQKLPFARAYHTPWFDVFTEPLRRYFDTVAVGRSGIAVYSCITGRRYRDDPDEVRDIISAGWASTVRFREAIQAMYRDGVRIFMEAGPRDNLTGFIDDILRGKPYLAVPANVQQRSGIQQLQHMLAQLVAQGVPVRLRHLYERRNPSPAAYPPETAAGMQPVYARAPEGPPAVRGGEGEVVRRHFQTMARFLEVQNEVMAAYLRVSAATAEPPKGPFITEILDLAPGVRARARHRFSLDRDRLLAHHTLGRNISREDPELLGLPVVPLPVSMEILAEAAALLQPGQVLAGMRDFRACRWIVLEQPDVTVELTAEQRGPGAVYAAMRESGSGEAFRPIWAEGLVLFAPQYPPPVAPRPLALANERHSRWTPDRLYADGMFHGPAFQAVKAMGRIGENGATATLEVLPRGALFVGLPADPGFLLDPVLLDGAGQMLAFWSQEQLDPTGDVFPYRLAALDCYGPPPEPGARLECRLAVDHAGDKDIRSDIEIVDSRGRVLYRIQKREDRRFSQTPEFWQLRAAPRDSRLSDLWNEPIAAFRHQGPLVCCRLGGFSREFFESSQGIWRKTLAHLVLSRRERETWLAMRAVDKRRNEWLLGRCAAKDAVRFLVEKHAGVQLAPADVEIVPDPYGRPRVEGAWTARLRIQPAISISHSHGTAVALAALDPGQLVGIDLEDAAQRREGFEAVAFGPDERELLDAVRQEIRQEWALRMWCAKEAAGKALGRGFSMGMQAFHITGTEIDTGVVQLELRDRALDHFPQLRGRPMIAYTAREMNFVFSTIIHQQGAVQ
jgi:malonyl CoA-acyl carrier protein transacylase/phosphopantetheinyl transferase